MNRRDFLKAASTAAVTVSLSKAALGSTADSGAGGKQLRLGIDCYTLRDLDWKADQLLDYAASVGADAIQVNPGDLETREDAYLRRVCEYARRVGVAIEPGINAISPLSGRWNPRRQGMPTEHLLLVPWRRLDRLQVVRGSLSRTMSAGAAVDGDPHRFSAALRRIELSRNFFTKG
jgi:hypothetical protein